MTSNSNPLSNIKIYGKVRAPLQHEIYSSNTSTGSISEKKLKTQSSKTAITYPKQSSLFQDYPYTFYSPEIENNQRIIYLKNPVKGKLLEKSFKIENENRTIQDLVPEVSGVFELDKCFAQSYNNARIYSQTCKRLVVDALNGKSGTVLTMGPTSGGKAFLLRGDETKEKGLILQYLEDLLDGNEISRESGGNIYNFKCSIYGIYQNNIIDFLSPKFKEKLQVDETESNDEDNLYSDREILDIVEEKVLTVADFKHLHRKSLNNLKLYSNQFKNIDFKNDCHVIVSIINEKQNALPRESRACVNFVRLASTDNLVERKSVREDLKILLRHLLHCSTAANRHELSTVHQRCRLTQCLVPAMNEISNIVLFICISPAARSSEGSIYSIEFAYAIYQEILTGKTNPPIRRTPYRSNHRVESEPAEVRPSRAFTPNHTTDVNSAHHYLSRKRSSSTDDFNSLYDLYNKTKESIKKHDSIKIEDHSVRKKTTEASEEDDSLFGIEGEMTNLKKEIYIKIDEVIEESLNPPITNDPVTERYYNESLHAKRNLKQIKKSIEHKEILEREAMKTLREKERRAKDKVRNYREKMRELEELLIEKDNHIDRLEESIRLSKKEIKNSEKKIVNLFEKEEAHHQNEDHLQDTVDKLRRKVITSKEKYRGKLALLKERILEQNDHITKLERDNIALLDAIEDGKHKSHKEHATLKSVQEDLGSFKSEFEKQEKIINIMKENTSIQDKMIEELKLKVVELARDNEKLLYERENLNTVLLKEREKGDYAHVNLKKLQNQSLKLEQRNAELEKEILNLKRDREGSKKLQDEECSRLYQQLTEIKKDLEQTKFVNEDLQKRTYNDDVKREKQIREFQAEAKVLYQNVNEERQRNKELIEENTRLVEQSKQKLALIDKYERQLDRIGSEQGNQLHQLERKVEELVRDIQDLKRENSNLRETEVALLRKLDVSETGRQELYTKCAEYKADNKILRENLREIDEKMKKLLYQNNIELKVMNLSSSRTDFRKNTETEPY